METPSLDRPIPESPAPWPLSAPESYVLLHGPRAKSVEAFKRGLLEGGGGDAGSCGDGDGGGWGDGDGGGGWRDGGGGD